MSNIHFALPEILSMERFFRMNLINSLSGYKSVHLIGTTHLNGEHNLAIFNAVFHIGANPPLMGFIIRPHTIARHTYENIKQNEVFTINHVPQDLIWNAHQTSAKYPASVSEFSACGFTPYFHPNFKAPFVEASPIRIGLTLEEEHHIKANGTIMIIGKVQHLLLSSKVLKKSGHLAIEESHTAAVVGLDTYYKMEKLKQFSYARPDEPAVEI